MDPAWIALIATVCGGIGLKVVEYWLGRSKVKIDDATRIRDELRTEVNGQKAEISELEAAVEEWRGKYYDLRDKNSQAQTELLIALSKIKEEET